MYGLKPEYPSEARAKGLTGSGVVLLKTTAEIPIQFTTKGVLY